MRARRRATSTLFPQLTAVLLIGLALAMSLFLLLNLGASIAFGNRVFPGVSLAGVSLSGLTQEQVAARVAQTAAYPEIGRLTLTNNDQSWVVRPEELGFFLDPQSTAALALQTARSGRLKEVLLDRFNLLRGGIQLQPSFIYSQQQAVNYLTGLAAQINQPLREASLEIQGTDVIINNGQPGRALDIPTSLAAISAQVQLMQDATIPLVVLETQPVILDASAQGELARAILSQPFILTTPALSGVSSREWQIDPATLAKMLAFQRVNDGATNTLELVIDEPLMSVYLESLQEDINAEPENARFIFNDETLQLDLMTPSVTGRALDITNSIPAINTAIRNGERGAQLALDITDPAVSDQMTGADLGITELVGAYTSYFRGSSADRVQNIQTASATFHGLLIPPGGVLSMAEVLGDITLDNGYAEALIILGDETIKGVGGGVCQVSTTLFRTVFYSGYPILERHAHAYRVGYYEQTVSGHDTRLAGLDATVFLPLVDFRFQNDTPYWLLMETYVSTSNQSLTWKFYSTSDGREVDYSTTGVTNVVEPPDPLYRENPELDKGQVKQVDWEVEGADVEVIRTVTRNGETLYTDRFVTQYEPWRDIFEYGPGTDGMPPDPNAPKEPEDED